MVDKSVQRHARAGLVGFPNARVVTSPNRGFGYGNNRGLVQASARYNLLLNPDTKNVEGTFGDLIELLDRRPQVGLAGVRQITADGTLWPSIRRFPGVGRAFGEAMCSERWPVHPTWAGERVLDSTAYEREEECDWTSGCHHGEARGAIGGRIARRAVLHYSGA